MNITFRITGEHHRALHAHLFPGDGREAVSLGVCGRLSNGETHVMCLRRLVHVPHSECSVRRPDRVTWSTKRLEELLVDATERGFAVVKIHSHPSGYDEFSSTDDESDRDLFGSVHGWTDRDDPHLSVVMLPSGRMFARAIHASGEFEAVNRVAIAGNDIVVYDRALENTETTVRPEQDRHARFFGDSTTLLMQRLSVGVVGCSGTGGPMCEMLARLGVGRMVVVDPDQVGYENLNRIPNATREDAEREVLKVDVVSRAVGLMGMGTQVVPIAKNIAVSTSSVRALASCDVLFGCVDSAEGRHVLSKIATFYNIPFIDVGIKLEAGAAGQIEEVCGAVHYLQPGASTLLDRGVYTMDRVNAEGLRREDPERYQEQRRDNYIQGVDETRPAVVTVNTFFAARAANEFLARLHPYRLDPNEEFAWVRESLAQMQQYCHPEEGYERTLARYVGRGDMTPLLNTPSLIEDGEAR